MEAEDRAHEVRQGVVAKVRGHVSHAQALARHQLHSLQQAAACVFEWDTTMPYYAVHRQRAHQSLFRLPFSSWRHARWAALDEVKRLEPINS